MAVISQFIRFVGSHQSELKERDAKEQYEQHVAACRIKIGRAHV